MKLCLSLLFLSLLLSLFPTFIKNAHAEEMLWKSGNVFVAVYEDKKANLLYSGACKKSKCDALELTKNLSWKSLSKDATTGGKNPGAVLCKEALKQNIIYLKDLSGNENTFCLFKDKSFISSSSLSVIASKNEQKGK